MSEPSKIRLGLAVTFFKTWYANVPFDFEKIFELRNKIKYIEGFLKSPYDLCSVDGLAGWCTVSLDWLPNPCIPNGALESHWLVTSLGVVLNKMALLMTPMACVCHHRVLCYGLSRKDHSGTVVIMVIVVVSPVFGLFGWGGHPLESRGKPILIC